MRAHGSEEAQLGRDGQRADTRDLRRLRRPLAHGDVKDRPYQERRELLESFGLKGSSYCTVSSFEGAGAELFAACDALKLEGLVAKRLDGRCESGVRSKFWVKAKCADWFEHHAQYRHARR